MAVRADLCTGGQYEPKAAFVRLRGGCPRDRSIVCIGAAGETAWHNLYCFSTSEDAADFIAAFGGELFDPKKDRRDGVWHRT